MKFTAYSSTPLLLMLQPSTVFISDTQSLPFKAYEPTIEIRDRKTRSVFLEASYTVETGEAERIAVDWTAKGGSGGTSCKWQHVYSSVQRCYSRFAVESHLQSQRAAVKMLHDRILVLVKYVTEVIAGTPRLLDAFLSIGLTFGRQDRLQKTTRRYALSQPSSHRFLPLRTRTSGRSSIQYVSNPRLFYETHAVMSYARNTRTCSSQRTCQRSQNLQASSTMYV